MGHITLSRFLCLLYRKGNTHPNVTYREWSDRVKHTSLFQALNEFGFPIIHNQFMNAWGRY
jgi:hypothetical protein